MTNDHSVRSPSSDGESAICATSLNKPSSQEGLKPVEMLYAGLEALLAAVHAGDPKRELLVRVGDAMREAKSAATLISELQAELDLLQSPTAVHLNMLGGAIAKPSWKNILHLYPEEAARHPSFNDAVEAAAKIVDEPLNGIEINRFIADGKVMTDRYGRELFITKENVEHILAAISSAIRSLKLPDYRGGEAKTAESDHSPSTREG